MKAFLLIIAFFAFTSVNGQEYWDRKDFEIGNRGIEYTWKEFSFVWQQESNFNLPDGSFLHLKDQTKQEEVDMLAVIDKTNRNRVQRKIDLGSPLPQKKEKERKIFELTGDVKVRDPNEVFLNSYYPSPFMQNYNGRLFNMRRYSTIRYNN